jgi:hypothetical protein
MDTLSPTTLRNIRATIRQAARKAIQIVVDALGVEHSKKGACLRVYHWPKIEEGYVGLIEIFDEWIGGDANYERLRKYMIVSVEKAIRLAMNARSLGHVSSWESRDPTDAPFRDKFGGAILVRCIVPEIGPEPIRLIFTTSGLNEMGDEATCLLAIMDLPWQAKDVSRIIAISNNEIAARYIFS